ncbi:uncharacterized protein LOC126376285 isoform X1 [Pectinophora gossypiella]|uniref:uncharacterized protein LOC126376285 isoform X1 n=1 Tax=Pectinophora gossypiella TaxID=13191 RepID=UPI00214E75E1|nr:uncharacterized protein LOC126376285 isoform X1 [Pectinophora gossypiella]
MENIPEDRILKFHRNTLEDVRKTYGYESSADMKNAVDILDEWMKTQNHFVKKDFSREYLERTIITTKGSVERAKSRLDKVCTLRTLMPHFFGEYDVKEYFKEYYYKYFTHAAMPQMTEDNYRVFVLKNVGSKYESRNFLDYYRLFIIFAEYLRAHDYANGYIFVMDYTELSLMDFLPKMNPVDLRQALTVLMEGYGVRIKGIHLITQSKFIDGVVAVFKQVLSTKVGERIQVHKDMDSLHKFVPKEILPREYGGEDKSLRELHDAWVEVLSSESHTMYQKMMNAAKTDESLRQTDKFNDQYMGMPGTFRTLSVD